jgi:hypothetical protein
MKKHIFGFLLFSFIVASFGLIFAFFYAPSIPPKESVKPPVPQTVERVEKPYSCPTKRNKISYEVLNSKFDLDGNELISKVKVSWTGSGAPPSQIYVRTELFTLVRNELTKTLETVTFEEVFENRSEATLIVVSKLDKVDSKIDEKQNLYVTFNFSEEFPTENYSNSGKNVAEAHPVLFVHGDVSEYRPNLILKDKRTE